MTFQLINNVKMTLAADLASDATELVVLDSDLGAASLYDPTKQLALTLIGDEELNQYEIVYVVERTGTKFRVTRGEENTTPGHWGSGATVIAALTADVLKGVTQAPTTADNVSYEGGNFGESSSVEQVLDDYGDAIIRLASDTEYYESVLQRVGGGLFTGGTVLPAPTSVLRWQGSAKRFATLGGGVEVVTEASMSQPTVPPDVALCWRVNDNTNLQMLKIRCFNAAAPTNYMEWTFTTAPTYNNMWTILFLPASAATNGGTPSTILPDRVQLTFKDDGTGPLVSDVNFFDVVATRLSYLGAFLKVHGNSDFGRVNTVAQYGFRVSLVIDNLDLPALDAVLLRRAQVDGHRIYLTSTSDFKAQTITQTLTTLYSALRGAFKVFVKPDGWVYLNGYVGPFDGDPTRTVRGAVATVFPRGVGVGTFRSAVEVYRFDDPLVVATDLANAQSLLTGTNKLAINVDLSALTNAELGTLMSQVITSGNFYTTSLDSQNADNIISGTLDPARLPVVPIIKGGTSATTAVQALKNLGLYDASSNIIAPNAVIANNNYVLGRGTVYAKGATTGNVHFWLQGPAGEDRMVLYTPSATPGNTNLRVTGTQNFVFNTSGQFRAPGAVYAGDAFMNTNGNITGSVWNNLGYDDAYNAIVNRIESRAKAWADNRVSSLQFRKVTQGYTVMSGTGYGDKFAPAGAVMTGLQTNQYYPVAMYTMYLQWYNPASGGWVGFTG